MESVVEGDIAVIDYRATVVDESDSVVAEENGRMRLRAGDRGALGGIDIAVVGMSVGAKKELLIPPDRAFGGRDPDLVMAMPRKHFHSCPNLKAGSLIKICSKTGKEIEVVTREVADETVIVDANEPLAGMTLNFIMTVRAIESV
jgi:peptidylprolyl isomerase